MPHDITYMPILRSKHAEFNSLKQLADTDRSIITPLIDVLPETLKVKKQSDIPVGLMKLAHSIDQVWHSYPICIDARRLSIFGPSGSLLTKLWSNLHRLERPMCPELRPIPIPVIGIAGDAQYEAAVRRIIVDEKTGLCLRLTSEDLRRVSLREELRSLLKRLECHPDEVNLVIDFKFVNETSTPRLMEVCIQLPYLSQWKSVIVGAGSFPVDLQEYKAVGEYTLPRHEWLAWYNQMTALARPPRFLSFGDYAIYHPHYKEQAPYTPSASIRYASDEHWVIMRGKKPNARKGAPGTEQYMREAVALREREEYQSCGPGFSAGDAHIALKAEACRLKDFKHTGNATTWLEVGFNHHLALTGRNAAAVQQAFANEGSSQVA